MTEVGILPPTPDLRQLKSVSPSTYLGFRQFEEGKGCALSLLWAGEAPLPPSPASLVGQIAHEVLDSAVKVSGVADGCAWAESKWEEEGSALADKFKVNWLYQGLLPLRATARGYTMKRLATIRKAAQIASDPKAIKKDVGSRVFTEESIASEDGSISGRIDLAFKTPAGWILKDYKSGAVTEEDDEGSQIVKPDYESQMHLYAILFQDHIGELPARIFLVPLMGPEVEVPLNTDRCAMLRSQVRKTIEVIKSFADKHDPSLLAMPLPADRIQHAGGCSFCRFRPFCVSYKAAEKTEDHSSAWPKDAWGCVSAFERRGDGAYHLEIENENTRTDTGGNRIDAPGFTVRLSGDVARHPALKHIFVGSQVEVYNYLKSKSRPVAIDGPLTTVYALPPK